MVSCKVWNHIHSFMFPGNGGSYRPMYLEIINLGKHYNFNKHWDDIYFLYLKLATAHWWRSWNLCKWSPNQFLGFHGKDGKSFYLYLKHFFQSMYKYAKSSLLREVCLRGAGHNTAKTCIWLFETVAGDQNMSLGLKQNDKIIGIEGKLQPIKFNRTIMGQGWHPVSQLSLSITSSKVNWTLPLSRLIDEVSSCFMSHLNYSIIQISFLNLIC